MGGLAERFVQLVLDHSYLAIFLIMVVEETGIPMPVPGDGMLVFAGYLAGLGRISLGRTLLVVDLGALIGASVLFWLAHQGGRRLVLRYGRLLRIDERRLDQVLQLFQRFGPCSTGISRLIPGLRIYTSALAGLAGVPFGRFLWNVAWACSVWALAFLWLGQILGERWRTYGRISQQATFVLVAAAAMLLLTYWCARRARRWWVRRHGCRP